MRRLDIGIASYGNPDGLLRVLDSLVRTCVTDWRCNVVVNEHPDEAQMRGVNEVLVRFQAVTPRIRPTGTGGKNIGYVGAVNDILQMAETEYVAYLDHDVVIGTQGWDEIMAHTLDRYHEIGMIFPGGGQRVPRSQYDEILWGVGCMWMLPKRVFLDVGRFDDTLGHHEEVDYQTRVRLQGLKIAAAHGIAIAHMAKATSDPAAQKRISDGVVRWVNKWCGYFGGKQLNYHSTNVLRHEDWPTSALHMEEYWKLKLPGVAGLKDPLNENPEVITVDGAEYDIIKVPRLKGHYRGRVI